MDALAERCFQIDADKQELLRLNARGDGPKGPNAAFWIITAFLLVAWFLLAGWPFELSVEVTALGVMVIVLAAAWLYKLPELVRRRNNLASVRKGVEAYERGEPWAVAHVHQYAVEEFRKWVAERRERTLGDGSEWSRSRASLVAAASEAQRSTAYWRIRLRQEPDNEFVKSQKSVSVRLQVKLAKALEELDSRSDALRKFYIECDVRLAAMDRRNRDLEEFRRLEELSGRADIAIAEAEGTIYTLLTSFVTEARAFADALGGVASVGIKSLAGEAPMDNIEYFADQIIEDSERDRAAIQDLERRLAP